MLKQEHNDVHVFCLILAIKFIYFTSVVMLLILIAISFLEIAAVTVVELICYLVFCRVLTHFHVRRKRAMKIPVWYLGR